VDDKELENSVETFRYFKEAFENPNGELVLEYLKKIAHYDLTTIHAEDKNDLSQWREGRRSLLLDILTLVKTDVGRYQAN